MGQRAQCRLQRGLTVNRTTMRIVAIAIATMTLSACSAIRESQILEPGFWNAKGPPVNDLAEMGLAEVAKGDNIRAQGFFDRALRANPVDVHALYGLALLYQNTGQSTRALQLYKRILAIRPVPTEEILIWADKKTHPIVDIAQVNTQLLNSGGMVQQPGGAASSMSMDNRENPAVPQPYMQAQTSYQSPSYQTPSYQPRMRPQQPTQPRQQMAPAPLFKDADLNIVARFRALRSLLDQGLVTQDEFLIRRKVNVGALLPLTSPPPATGLDRPVPPIAQVSGRLNAIGRALEMRALSPAQHMAERTMIVDALMPEKPISRANPVPPPHGLMEAADAVRRLEMLQKEDLITSDEYAKERAAIEKSMQPRAPTPMAEPAQSNISGAGAKASKKSISGFQPAVHLASFRQKKSALRGWRELKKRYRTYLGGLKTSIERVDLGGGKGVFYRLKAGPLPSNAAAKNLCRKLKAKRQYCDPTTINFG